MTLDDHLRRLDRMIWRAQDDQHDKFEVGDLIQYYNPGVQGHRRIGEIMVCHRRVIDMRGHDQGQHYEVHFLHLPHWYYLPPRLLLRYR